VGVINLPAALQCHLAIPIKNANYKINLNTDIPCENVTTTTTTTTTKRTIMGF